LERKPRAGIGRHRGFLVNGSLQALGQQHSALCIHGGLAVLAFDAPPQLDDIALELSVSLEKMTCDAATGTVIYHSKMQPGLKRNFQVMPGAEWLELLCKHIPDRPTPLRIRAMLTSSTLQAAERRRNMLWAQCAAARHQRQTVTIGHTREKSRIEFPIVYPVRLDGCSRPLMPRAAPG
jgi:hypothetical protein